MPDPFEWDAGKSIENVRRHGVTFEEASTVFKDPLGLVVVDPDHSDEEARYLLVGTSARQRLLVIAFTERSPRLRIISARLATRRERRRYEAQD